MSLPFSRESRAFRVVLAGASLVVIVAGLRAAAPILLPVLVALFLALLFLPAMIRLERIGLPRWASVTAVVLLAAAAVLLVTVLVGSSVDDFREALPRYRARLTGIVEGFTGWLAGRGIDVRAEVLSREVDSGTVLALVGDTAAALLSALSNLVLVLLLMVFMLVEARELPGKLRRAAGDPDADLGTLETAVENVRRYLAIKAWVSLFTGAAAGLLCLALGIDFPLLWGLAAFLLNFVPNIGSIIAAIPPVLLALVQFGGGRALAAAAGFVVINMVLGNVVEPRWMGRRLGLSTFVVFASMLFWGWVWGPVGMLLSVPLTVVVKILAENSEDFRGVAVLLGPGDEVPPPVRAAVAAGAASPPGRAATTGEGTPGAVAPESPGRDDGGVGDAGT
jgi:predicted PurR-regulated permease PerM